MLTFKIDRSDPDHETVTGTHGNTADIPAVFEFSIEVAKGTGYPEIRTSIDDHLEQNNRMVDVNTPGVSKVLEFGTQDSGNSYHGNSQGSYKIVRQILFPGTDTLGVPARVRIIAWVEDAAKPGAFRIEAPAGQVLELTGITNTAPAILDAGVPSNLPASNGILELQIKGNSGKNLYVSSVVFEWN